MLTCTCTFMQWPFMITIEFESSNVAYNAKENYCDCQFICLAQTNSL